jgi:hypothetical protein
MTHPSGARHSQSIDLDREGSTLAFAAMVRLVRVVGEMSADRFGLGKTFSVNSTRLGMVAYVVVRIRPYGWLRSVSQDRLLTIPSPLVA